MDLQRTVSAALKDRTRIARILGRSIFLTGVVLFCTVSAARVSAQPPRNDSVAEEKEPPVTDEEFRLPVDPPTAARIEQLILRLGSPEYKQRVEGTTDLLVIGAPAFAKLREAYHNTDDFEIRSRIEAIVRRAYLDHYVFDRMGFLGISQNTQHTPTHADDSRITKGHVGIKIVRVIENTGAERAGLQEEDVIVGIDGEPLSGAGIEAVQAFGAGIRSRGPGANIILTILRGQERLEIPATLGRPPMEMVERGNLGAIRDNLYRARDRFEIWWFKYFRQQSGRHAD